MVDKEQAQAPQALPQYIRDKVDSAHMAATATLLDALCAQYVATGIKPVVGASATEPLAVALHAIGGAQYWLWQTYNVADASAWHVAQSKCQAPVSPDPWQEWLHGGMQTADVECAQESTQWALFAVLEGCTADVEWGALWPALERKYAAHANVVAWLQWLALWCAAPFGS